LISLLNRIEHVQFMSTEKRPRQRLHDIVYGSEPHSLSTAEKEDSPLFKTISANFHSENSKHYEFGQKLTSSDTSKPEVPFSIKKKNSHLDVFKRSKFSLALEHKVS